jgi:hypothetical protein
MTELDAYRFVMRGNPADLKGRFNRIWLWHARVLLGGLIRRRSKAIESLMRASEGDPEILYVERLVGGLGRLLSMRGTFDANVQRIWDAPWRRVPQGRLRSEQAT